MKAFTRFFKLFNRGLSVALILCLFCLATALAASGGLDTTFSGDGKLTLDLAAGKSGKARMAAVQSDGEGRFVWIVGDDTARRKAVEVKEEQGDRVVLASGVGAGDKVVVRGVERLAGESVKVRLVE